MIAVCIFGCHYRLHDTRFLDTSGVFFPTVALKKAHTLDEHSKIFSDYGRFAMLPHVWEAFNRVCPVNPLISKT